jgi:peroxiredoxin
MPTTIDAPTLGSIMPDIALTEPDGSAHSLRALTSGRRSLVFFMRAATCPICNAHVKAIAALELKDTAIVVVTPGTARDAASVAAKTTLQVLASGEHGHAEAGLGRFLGLQHSGTFVLDADGRVLAARTATLPTGAFDKSEVLALLG